MAGYPETHQEAISPEADLQNLHRKVTAGGEVVITQLFYDNADFFRFRDRCTALGISVPIVPGILPITNLAQVQRITSMCKARLPENLLKQLTAAGDDECCSIRSRRRPRHPPGSRTYQAAGVPGIHFYVLNKSPATVRVLQAVRR